MNCANLCRKIRCAGGVALLMGLALVLLMGCEEDVLGPEPHAFPFSMWGVINPLADTQFVRVFPIETSLDPGVPEPLDARFTSVDLGTGEEWVWRDSVIVDAAGVVGHVFYAPFRAAFEHTYRLEIRREDGARSWVEVEIPRRLTLVLSPPDTSRGVILQGMIQGEAQRLLRSEVVFSVGYVIGFSPPPVSLPIFKFIDFVVPYDRLQRTAEGWQLMVDLEDSYFDVFSEVRRDEEFVSSEGIRLGQVTFRAVVANEEWMPPGGVFDPTVLVQPGVMENVENGFGFVGGGYRLSRSWTLPFDVVEKTSFIPNR